MEAFFSILQDVEPDITRDDRAKECLSRRPKLKEFLQHCCYERKYVFGVKKCGKSNCKICQSSRLPEPIFIKLHHIPDPVPENEQHYKPFSSLYGTLTTERDRPSLKNGGQKDHRIPFNPNTQTARAIIMCSECLRPRVIYARYKLIHAEQVALYRTIEGLLYTCGSTLKGVQVETQSRTELSVVNGLFEKIYVQENNTCSDPVEIPYYSSERFQPICTPCACECDVAVE